jgi:hypothetical protein
MPLRKLTSLVLICSLAAFCSPELNSNSNTQSARGAKKVTKNADGTYKVVCENGNIEEKVTKADMQADKVCFGLGAAKDTVTTGSFKITAKDSTDMETKVLSEKKCDIPAATELTLSQKPKRVQLTEWNEGGGGSRVEVKLAMAGSGCTSLAGYLNEAHWDFGNAGFEGETTPVAGGNPATGNPTTENPTTGNNTTGNTTPNNSTAGNTTAGNNTGNKPATGSTTTTGSTSTTGNTATTGNNNSTTVSPNQNTGAITLAKPTGFPLKVKFGDTFFKETIAGASKQDASKKCILKTNSIIYVVTKPSSLSGNIVVKLSEKIEGCEVFGIKGRSGYIFGGHFEHGQ